MRRIGYLQFQVKENLKEKHPPKYPHSSRQQETTALAVEECAIF